MIHRVARYTLGAAWLRGAWLRLHEPRIISASYGLAYAVAAVVGILATVYPPQTLGGVVGAVLMAAITLPIAAGGLFGLLSVTLGNYWAERTAASLVITGLAFWGGMTAHLQFIGSGNRGLTLMAAAFGVFLFALRFYWIGNRPYNPRLHMVSGTES